MFKKLSLTFVLTLSTLLPLFSQFSSETVVARDLEEMCENIALDLNNDGHLDVLTSGQGGIVWNAGDGNGNFTAQQMIYYTANFCPDFAVGDFDSDGFTDVVVYDAPQSQLLIFRNNGEGIFRERIILEDSERIMREIIAGDVDSDGDTDIIILVVEEDVEKLLYFDNEGGLSFAVPQTVYDDPFGFTRVEFADLNQDGFLDIVGYGSSVLAWLQGNGQGNFFYAPIDDSSNLFLYDFSISDIDSDGDMDVIAGGTSRIYSFLNDGLSTSFTTNEYGQGMTGLNTVRKVYAEDITGDGFAELFYVTFYSDQTGYLVSNGEGGYDTKIVTDFDADEGRDITTADFNEDGITDMLYVCFKGIRISEGNADEGFDPMFNILTDDPTVTSGIKSMDVDNDGDLDLIAAYADYTSETEKKLLWYENVDNNFRVQHFIDDSSDGVGTLQVADMDNDGFKDIIITTRQTHLLQIYYNQGNGTFSAPDVIEDDAEEALHVADFNNDGLPDLLYVDLNYVLYYRENMGNGNFDWPDSNGDFNLLVHINSGDMNNDGHLDIIYADYSNNAVRYKPGNSNGEFSGGIPIANGLDGPRSAEVGDLDSDGFLDVVVTSSQSDELIVFRSSDGGQEYTTVDIISEREFPYESRLADFDNDGDLDVLCNFYSDYVVWFENDGAGGFSEAATLSLDSDGINNTLAVADIDNNGGIDAITGFGFFEECKVVIYFNENTQVPTFSSQAAEVFCNDNGTPYNITDDRINFELLVESNYLSQSYSVSAEGLDISPNNAIYNVEEEFSLPPGSAGAGDVTITVTDSQNFNFTATQTLIDPGICSSAPSMSASLEGSSCFDNNTPSDPTDDIIRFSLQVNGLGTSPEYTLNTGAYAVIPDNGAYEVNLDFELEPGSAGNGIIGLQIADAENPEITTNVVISDPGTCSTTVSVNNPAEDFFTLLPNLTEGFFSLHLKQVNADFISIRNTADQLILTEPVNARERIDFDLSGKPSGTYLVSLTDKEGRVFVQRVFVY